MRMTSGENRRLQVLAIVGMLALCVGTEQPARCQQAQPKPPPGDARTLWTWRGTVMTMAFAHDGTKLVTGGAAKKDSVNVWDPSSGRHIVGIDAGALVYSLDVAPDGKRIATTGFVEKGDEFSPRTAVWIAETGKKLFDIDDPRTGKKPCLAYSPDGKLLATNTLVGDDDKSAGAVQLRNADTGEKIGGPLVGLSETFSRIVFSPDGKLLAAASWGDRTYVVLWEVQSRKRIAVLETKATWTLIRSLAFSADGTQLIWVTGNEVAPDRPEHVLWEVASGRRLGALLTDSRLAWVAFEPAGDELRTVSLDSAVERWNLKTLKRTAILEPGIESMTQAACLSPDRKTLAIGTGTSDALAPPSAEDGAIHLLDATTGRERLSPAAEAARKKAEADNAELLAAGERLRKQAPPIDADKRARLLRYALAIGQAQQAIERGCLTTAKKLLAHWIPEPGAEDLRSFEWHHLWMQCPVRTFVCEQLEAINPSYQHAQPLLSPDGKILAVADMQQQITLWDLATARERTVIKASGPVAQMEFSADSAFLVAVVGRKRFTPDEDDAEKSGSGIDAVIWDAKSGVLIATLNDKTKPIRSVAFAPDGKSAAVGHGDGSVQLHTLPSSQVTATLSDSTEPATVLNYAPDGKSIAVGTEEGKIRVWTVGAKSALLDRADRKQPIRFLQFDRNGKTLFSVDDSFADRAAQRWIRTDSGTWKEMRRWPGTFRVTLSPNGKRLAVLGWDGVLLWDLVQDKMIGRIVPWNGLASQAKFAPDSRTLLVHAREVRGEPEFLLFDADTGDRLAALDGVAQGHLTGLHLGKEGMMTATSDVPYGHVRMAQHVVEAKLGQAVRRRIIQGAKGFGMWGIPSIDFDAKGDRLAIADGDGLYVWSLKEDRIQEYGPYNNFPIRTARFSDDGRRVLSIDASNFAIWDAETKIRAAYIGARYGAIGADGKTFFGFDDSAVLKTHSAVDGTSRQTVSPARPIQDVREVIGRTDAREYFNEVDVSPTGRWVVGPGVLLFDTSIKRHVAEFKPSTPPTRIVFAPDERSLIASDEAGKIVVWDLPAIRPRYAVPEVGTILALSADGRIVAASQGGGVNLFDVQTASLIARIDGLTGPPARAEFAPDGRTLVIGTTDGMLGFWCTTTGAPRMSARTPRAAVKSVRFSTDGRLLAVGAGHSVIVRRADR